MLKRILHRLLTLLYKVELTGLENYHNAGNRVLIVANHSSFLDPLLLGVFLPGKVTFAINTYIAQTAWIKPFLLLCRVFPMDPTNPLSSKSLISYLKTDQKAVIFPEGRITVTGSLMKIYDGTGLAAVKSQAVVLPIRIDGAQYTPFSRMRGRVRLRWFPKIKLNILPAVKIDPPIGMPARERRKHAGRVLADLMTEMIFETSDYQRTVFAALLDARRIHGGRHIVLEDLKRRPLHYNALITQSLCLAIEFDKITQPAERVGVLLPNSTATVSVMLGLQSSDRVPAMLNYTAGTRGMVSACETATIRIVLTSRQFEELADLKDAISVLSEKVEIQYLEDVRERISKWTAFNAWVRCLTARYWYPDNSQRSNHPAVVLFTSGSEGSPKGVVLSHSNLLANRAQLAARVDFNAQDVILNILPLFHSFGLTAGTLTPLLSGMRMFLYPSPLHYRVVPEISYEINATILFGTNTFLAGYAKHAHPYDFYSVRYVFAGAEKLQDETRQIWSNKFGIRIFEGYGATETSPVLAANTPMDNKPGAVGRLLPGVSYRLEPVPGVDVGAKLHVFGPNIMQGYLLPDNPGVLAPPKSKFGVGWYDTGDIVEVDEQGFVIIQGRAKRFAKVGGEMVSLAVAENIAASVWPEGQHAVVAIADPKKGEQLVLVTDVANADRQRMVQTVKGIGEINLPKHIIAIDQIPLMGSGKVDYPAVTDLVIERLDN